MKYWIFLCCVLMGLANLPANQQVPADLSESELGQKASSPFHIQVSTRVLRLANESEFMIEAKASELTEMTDVQSEWNISPTAKILRVPDIRYEKGQWITSIVLRTSEPRSRAIVHFQGFVGNGPVGSTFAIELTPSQNSGSEGPKAKTPKGLPEDFPDRTQF